MQEQEQQAGRKSRTGFESNGIHCLLGADDVAELMAAPVKLPAGVASYRFVLQGGKKPVHLELTYRAGGVVNYVFVWENGTIVPAYQDGGWVAGAPVEDALDRAGIEQAIRAIGLALHSCNNCVTMDLPEKTPVAGESWRIDHSREIAMLGELAATLGVSSGTAHECAADSIRPSSPQPGAL